MRSVTECRRFERIYQRRVSVTSNKISDRRLGRRMKTLGFVSFDRTSRVTCSFSSQNTWNKSRVLVCLKTCRKISGQLSESRCFTYCFSLLDNITYTCRISSIMRNVIGDTVAHASVLDKWLRLNAETVNEVGGAGWIWIKIHVWVSNSLYTQPRSPPSEIVEFRQILREFVQLKHRKIAREKRRWAINRIIVKVESVPCLETLAFSS